MPPVIPIGTPLIQLDVVDSSNNYAMAQAQAQMAGHGAAWLAKEQTLARGQRGKKWQSEPGQNIALSTIITPSNIGISEQFHLSVMAALACHDFLTHYVLTETSIKWPNDLYWRDRKAGGILIENLIQGSEWKCAVVGIGININQVVFDPALPNPVSFKQVTEKDYDVLTLGQHLCTCLEIRWQQLNTTGFPGLLKEYNEKLYKINDQARLKVENAIVDATILGVNEKGELLVKTDKLMALSFGTVEWIVC